MVMLSLKVPEWIQLSMEKLVMDGKFISKSEYVRHILAESLTEMGYGVKIEMLGL